MSTNALISLHQLSYIHPNEKALFRDLTATISRQKTALVGSNGVGKSTLLRLILGELEPTHGSINTFDSIAYCPQKLVFDTAHTVVSFLGYAGIINALERVEQGSIDPIDYDLIGDHWDIKEKVIDQLATIGLSYLALNQKIETLSGGEKTKLSLLKAELSQSDLIILDEPTNHLDYKSRSMLYQWIEESDQGFLIVSHDRQLLDKMDAIIELNSHGLTHYGGNYAHYQRQKALILSAREDDLLDAKKQLQKAKRSAQASKEKLEQKRSVGRKAFLIGKVDKLTAKSKQGRSESSQARNSITEDRLVNDAHSRVSEASAKIEMGRQLSLDLSYTRLPQGKKVFVFDEVSFRYPDNDRWIIKDFSLSLFGPERVVIKGDNGVGKSTLLRLLTAELQAAKLMNPLIYLNLKFQSKTLH